MVRARLSTENAKKLKNLKEGTGRPYKDVFRFLFYLYLAYPERFPPVPVPERFKVFEFKLPHGAAAFFKDLAWLRQRRTAEVYNDLVEGLYRCLNERGVSRIVKERRDLALLLSKEERCRNRKTLPPVLSPP